MTAKFRKGSDAIEESNVSPSYAREHFLSIKDGESAIVRFVTDPEEWITVDQYPSVPTKPAPSDFKGKWPEKMNAISRSDSAFEGMYTDDWIAMNDYKTDWGKPMTPKARVWALACLREEVIGDGTAETGGPEHKGKRVGYRDQTREVTRTRDGVDTTTTEKAIVVVNQAPNNFFGTLTSMARMYAEDDKSLLQFDIRIRRTGSTTDTDYTMIALKEIVDADGKIFDLSDPETAAQYVIPGIDLAELVTKRSSDEYYERFFDTRVSNESKSSSGEAASPSATASAPAQEAPDAHASSSSDLSALADRIKGYSTTEADEGEESAAPAAAMNFTS